MFDPWYVGASDPFSPRPNHSQIQKTTSATARTKKLTVLVVDDERVIADTMTEILRRSGFDAICAYDGLSALELALKVNPDFVVTDVVMPHMNGVQLAIAIRKAMPATEILLLSGQAGITEIVDGGRKDGYLFELIAKPIHPEKLLQRLRTL
ncbi:MAG TPA: response regulator [Terracidiphilus sp.]|jgi:DNA-binding response OmpR family regulator